MKNQSVFFSTLMAIVLAFCSCSNKSNEAAKEKSLSYFVNSQQGIQTGGVKMISIETPKGKFNVWTKGSHYSMYDDQQTYMKGLIKFIKAIN